jgi:DNA-binding PadR family transcriptional regulator
MLSLLDDEPAHGYRLKQRFEEKIGDFWQLNGGQVYQTLRVLERDGWIEAIGPAPDPLAERNTRESIQYELTETGRDHLRGWLAKPGATPEPYRDEILVRLLVLDDAAEVETRRFIAHQQTTYSHYLARLSAKKRRLPSDVTKETLAARLGIDAAISHASAHLQWLGYCLEMLDVVAANPVVTDSEKGNVESSG